MDLHSSQPAGRMTSLRCRASHAFSLIELSVVITIVSIVAVMGLESVAMFLGQTGYQTTVEKLAVIDNAIADYSKQYARLPCPALNTLAAASVCYGKEYRNGAASCNAASNYTMACQAPTFGPGLQYGDVPVRDLGLPPRYMNDAYGNKLVYVVTASMVTAGTGASQFSHAASTDGILVRSGKLDTNCGGAGNLCQNRGSAAYFLMSTGRDRRGSYTPQGAVTQTCMPSATGDDGRIDTANCRFGTALTLRINNSVTTVTVPANAFYDSRFNTGVMEETYFDDIVQWRSKAGL